MKIISSAQYNEYSQLRRWAEKEGVYKSAKEVALLEDDIDTPIKKCIGMLALLQCQPKFSCCGFDYDGQPFHKSHQYGEPYIICLYSTMSFVVIKEIVDNLPLWKAFIRSGEIVLDLENGYRKTFNPDWRRENCIHFAEEMVIAIRELERFLWKNYNNMMLQEVVLEDSNEKYKKGNRYWRYPPKKAWVVKVEDVIP